MIPGFGEPADFINGIISMRRGDTVGAYLDMISGCAPAGGQVSGAANIGRRAARIGRMIRRLLDPAIDPVRRQGKKVGGWMNALIERFVGVGGGGGRRGGGKAVDGFGNPGGPGGGRPGGGGSPGGGGGSPGGGPGGGPGGSPGGGGGSPGGGPGPTGREPGGGASEGRTTVYSAVENGVTKYVGITDALADRAATHLRQKGIVINEIPGLSGVPREVARAVEQVLVETHGLGKNGGTLLNKINSIATDNPIYTESRKRGAELLKQVGYPGF